MKSFIAVSALIALVAAQNNTTGAAPSGSTPGGSGASPNANNCKDSYTMCKSGANPSGCDAANTKCQALCATAYDTCRVAPNANQAACVAQYSTCLGALPAFLQPGAGSGSTVVTKVVNSYVTYCPGATSFMNNGQLYVATGPTTITVTNCPCTVTSVVQSATATPVTGNTGNTGSGSSSCPGSASCPGKNSTVVAYKGAASSNSQLVAGGLSIAAVLSGVFAFAL